MAATNPELERLLARIEAGGLDALSPAEIAWVERALHDSDILSDRFTALKPPADSRLQIAVPNPKTADWERIWSNIETAKESARSGADDIRPWNVILWRAASAVAACLALFALWRSVPSQSSPTPVRALASSRNVEILELEVFGGRSSTLHFAEDGSGAVFISISDPDVVDSGA